MIVGVGCGLLKLDCRPLEFNVKGQSFSANYGKFIIKFLDPKSCYKARAPPADKKQTWFEIDIYKLNVIVSKTWGDPSKPGFEDGNTW